MIMYTFPTRITQQLDHRLMLKPHLRNTLFYVGCIVLLSFLFYPYHIHWYLALVALVPYAVYVPCVILVRRCKGREEMRPANEVRSQIVFISISSSSN